MRSRDALVLAIFFACWASVAGAQTTTPPPQPLTLADAIVYATDHYPAVKAAVEHVNASAAGVDVARGAYLPATRLALAVQSRDGEQRLRPDSAASRHPWRCPVRYCRSASSEAVWGSAAGALFSWEPVDFGLRHATVVGAQAALTQARADEALTRLDVQDAVAAAFLDVLAAQRAVTAAQADVDRRDRPARSPSRRSSTISCGPARTRRVPTPSGRPPRRG